MKKLTKLLYPTYVLALLLGFFFVKNTLKEGNIKVTKKEPDQEHVNIKPVVVFMEVKNGEQLTQYRARLTNVDSVLYMLEFLREKENFFFEKVMHTYGTEFQLVNKMEAPKDYKWALLHNGEDITTIAENIWLEDNATYTFELVTQ
jgi:hypothetical protein